MGAEKILEGLQSPSPYFYAYGCRVYIFVFGNYSFVSIFSM